MEVKWLVAEEFGWCSEDLVGWTKSIVVEDEEARGNFGLWVSVVVVAQVL